MKKLIAIIVCVLIVCSVAIAAQNLLGTKQHPTNGNKYRTTWAHPLSSTSGIINSTGATTAYAVSFGCDTGKIKVGDITGTGIMNMALQVADLYGPQYGASPMSDAAFTNAIGTDSAPYHQVDPTDTDTWKFDFSDREFTIWRLNCLAGCSATNYIETAWGDCWMAGTGGK